MIGVGDSEETKKVRRELRLPWFLSLGGLTLIVAGMIFTGTSLNPLFSFGIGLGIGSIIISGVIVWFDK